ncbi:hypothetical protein EDE04_7317 [Streptomyces sp. 2132.2]|uniref:hypothetical protein n=1 Tax=Streptomyces TaxID=1883 RepID=UPI000C18CE95|nr:MULTISPECIES: hypothetical protein [Streptomyces]ROQ88925.1 hypothetical protein EDE04_7317 [Streptomyces sp. 2132.2]GHE44111.1 hypothetical protein GCM10017778_29620 [Streptomyces vinaceus]
MDFSQNTDAPAKTALSLSRKAALGVAAAAVVSGALFSPSAFAADAAPTGSAVVAGCAECYPDVI